MELTANERTQIRLALSDYDIDTVYDVAHFFESMDSFKDVLEKLGELAEYFEEDGWRVDEAFTEGKEEGLDEGKDEGYDNGYEDGLSENSDTIDAVMNAIQSSADELAEVLDYDNLVDVRDKVADVKNDLVAIKAVYEN